MADKQTGAQTPGQPTTRQSQGGMQGGVQGGEGVDRERQLRVSREGGMTQESGTGMQRGAGRQPGSALAGRMQGQGSVLPALMANPWLMTNAFMANPFGFAQAMTQEMDRLFSGGELAPFNQLGAGGQAGRGLAAGAGQQGSRAMAQWAPQLEVRQRGNELVVSADLPGLTPDEVDIQVEDGVLTISGERQQATQDRQEGFYRSERSYGAFSRSIPLPEGVDEEQVRARFEHGVLEVTVPLPQPRPRGRRVQIQASGTQAAGATGATQDRTPQDRTQGQAGAQSGSPARG